MQKLNTLSETGVCLVVIGCFAYAGGIRCTVRNCFFKLTKITDSEQKIGTFPVTPHPAIILSGSSPSLGMPVVPLEALPLWTFEPNRHVRLASCSRHRSWPDTVLYTFTNNQQVLLVSQNPPETKKSSCHNLRTILSSTILPVFSFIGVSAAKSSDGCIYIWPTWPASCLQGYELAWKGCSHSVRGCSVTATPMYQTWA